MSKIFFAMEKFLDEGGTDPLIRGLISQPAKEIVGNALVNSELTQNLFPHNPNGLNLDLASLNINRAREHAIPGFNEWRKFCGLKPIEFWLELREIVRDPELITKLQRLYKRIGIENSFENF